LARYFQQFYPRECRLAGSRGLQKLVQAGIGRAADYGFLTTQPVATYINLMIILGSEFDTDPQVGWAREQLTDFSITDPTQRASYAFQSSLDYLDRISGTDGHGMAKAMLRIRRHDIGGPLGWPAAEFNERMLGILEHLHPEKAAAQGAEANAALIERARARASGHGIGSLKGQAVYAIAAFMLGIGFDMDPMYPWAAHALDGPGGEESQVKRLLAAAMDYLEASLRN
jgi:hypothetical protein